MVKHIHGERRPSSEPEQPTGLVGIDELQTMRLAIMQLVADEGGKNAPAWVRDFARVVETLATTYRRANELRAATVEQAAAIAEECGSSEAAARIRGLVT
jgi:hypothetical protein